MLLWTVGSGIVGVSYVETVPDYAILGIMSEYFPDWYFPDSYWIERYWPVLPDSLTAITWGYWPINYWPSVYWPVWYWSTLPKSGNELTLFERVLTFTLDRRGYASYLTGAILTEAGDPIFTEAGDRLETEASTESGSGFSLHERALTLTLEMKP